MVWNNDNLFAFYTWSTVGCASVLVALYAIALTRVMTGTKIPFITTLCVLLILSNLGAGLMPVANS